MMPTAGKSHNARLHEDANQRLRALLVCFESGMSVNEVARQWGISYQRVQKLRVKALELRAKDGVVS